MQNAKILKIIPKNDYQRFLTDIYSKADTNSKENIIIRQGKKKRSYLLTNYKILNQEIQKQFYQQDTYISINTFSPAGKKQGNASYNNLYAVYAWCIDIDYKKTGNEQSNPLNYYYDCISKILPIQPNWIEYGHNLRLIYILAEPIKMRVRGRENLVKALKRIQANICDILNEELSCTAERQTLSSYLRCPGSQNSKDGSEIKLQQITETKLTIQEILTEYMPDIPDWYESWKATKQKKVIQIHNSSGLWIDRLKGLENLRDSNINYNREKMIFWYAVGSYYTHTDKTLYAICQEFNKTLPKPYAEKTIRSKFRTIDDLMKQRHYKIKTVNLIDELGITKQEAERVGIMDKRTMERLEKIQNGTTRKQLAEKNYQTFCELRKQGFKLQEIADKMNMGIDQMKRYSQRQKSEN